ncbi:CS1-pili formation C-terminal domain-containing protein [Photobacterium damselae]|uniref:Pilus assembly protein C-terminal domain-containing protein n=1 Tax=Photobacterium damselae TaxID=38293 RepID=A0ABD6X7R8_PHODM|nr:CS1-pili formation C-terminal domain-containing protein [Photobacterium damselae]OBU43829.1 hypothetical protein AYY27_04345 [Photobacterium damselae]PSU18719.1 hypothetical protein CTM90_01680 [Photobacterium damselae]
MNSSKFRFGLYILLSIAGTKSFAIPKDFGDLFIEKKNRVSLFINDTFVADTYFMLSDETAKLLIGSESDDFVRQVKNKGQLTKDGLNQLLTDIKSGIKSSNNCSGDRRSCQLYTDKIIEYVIDKNSRRIRAFVPTRYLTNIVSKQYISQEYGSNALISKNNIYLNTSKDSSLVFQYNNHSFLGFGDGFFEMDSSIGADNSLYLLDYNYLNDGMKVNLGYFNRSYGTGTWNETSSLDLGENSEYIGVNIGSNRELLKASSSSSKKLFINSPLDGFLTIKDVSDKILLNKRVKQGANTIGLNELPKGNYSVKIIIQSGNETVYEENKHISNFSDYSMGAGDSSYYLSFGKLLDKDIENHTDNNIAQRTNEIDNAFFVKADYIYNLTDFYSLGVSGMSNMSESMVKSSLNLNFSDDVRASMIYGLFSNESYKYQFDLNLYGLYASYYNYNDVYNDYNSNKVSLNEYLLGYGDDEGVNLGYFFSVFGGNAYVNYTSSKRSDNDYHSETLDAGYRHKLDKDSELSISVSKNKSKFKYNNYKNEIITLSYNRTFNDNWYFDYDMGFADGKGFDSTLTKKVKLDLNNDLDVGVNIDDDYVSDPVARVRLDYNHNDSNYNASISTDIDNNKYYDLYSNVDFTTIITGDSIDLTSNNSSSYIKVDNDDDKIKLNQTDFSPNLQISKNGDNGMNRSLDNNTTIIATDEYKDYDLNVDTDSSEFINDNKSNVSSSSMPGKIIKLSLNLKKINTFMSAFKDVYGKDISNIKCIGEGCVSQSEVVNGVYKFKTIGDNFNIVSNNRKCIISSKNNSIVSGICLPVFEEKNGLRLAKSPNGDNLILIGVFEGNKFDDKIYNGKNLNILDNKVGNYHIVIAESNSSIYDSNFVDSIKSYMLLADKLDIFQEGSYAKL